MCRKRQQVCHGRISGADVNFGSKAWPRLSQGATFSTESAQKLKNVDRKSLSALRDRLVPIAIRELCDLDRLVGVRNVRFWAVNSICSAKIMRHWGTNVG